MLSRVKAHLLALSERRQASATSTIRTCCAPSQAARGESWNPSFDKRPALIVQPVDVPDIQAAVRFAREHNLLLAVKCSGHSHSGQSTCERGMQIDPKQFRGVQVDTARRLVAAKWHAARPDRSRHRAARVGDSARHGAVPALVCLKMPRHQSRASVRLPRALSCVLMEAR